MSGTSRIHQTQAVQHNGQPQGQQQQQTLTGHYNGYEYKVRLGQQQHAEGAHHAHESHHAHGHHEHARGAPGRGGRATGGGRKPQLTRRAKKTRTSVHDNEGDMDYDGHGSEMGGDHMDDSQRPFDFFERMGRLGLSLSGDQDNGGGQSGGGAAGGGAAGGSGSARPLRRKDGAGEELPKLKPAAPRRRQQDPGAQATQLKLPGAAQLFGPPAGRPVNGQDLIALGMMVVLGGMLLARMPIGRLMGGVSLVLLAAQASNTARLTRQDVKSLLMAQQRLIGWVPGASTPLPQATGDSPALAPLIALNACRPRTESMRLTAMQRLKTMLTMPGM